MGTDLVQIGNHKITFKDRSFNEIATEITERLNKIQFVNAEYLLLFALHWEDCEPRRVRIIREIKTKKKWTYREEDPENYSFAEDGEIEFFGPFNLHLIFTEHLIYFFNPPSRYYHWIEGDSLEDFAFRNEWRKYMNQIEEAVGGDRVIYLADNAHPLDGFAYMEVPFEEIEFALKEAFGAAKTTFTELAENPKNSYLIDYLQNIDWGLNISLEKYYPVPNDLTSIAYNLKEFETKEQLTNVKWDETFLKHKLVDGKIHFAHIVRFQGVLVEQYGILNELETHSAYLDEYAPFKYDELKSKVEQEYGEKLEEGYVINFYNNKDHLAWSEAINKFKKVLPWTGNGTADWSCSGIFKSSQGFYAADEKLAIDLLLLFGEEFGVTASMEIVRLNRIGKEANFNPIVFKR